MKEPDLPQDVIALFFFFSLLRIRLVFDLLLFIFYT